MLATVNSDAHKGWSSDHGWVTEKISVKPNPIEIDSLDARRTCERKRMVIDRNPASYATYPKCLETDQ